MAHRARISPRSHTKWFGLAIIVASLAASPVSANASELTIVSLSALNQGRIPSAQSRDSMFVQHVVKYCVELTTKTDSEFEVEFSSKHIRKDLAERGDGLVRGKLSAFLEPMDPKERRCGEIEFSVHADALLSTAPFAEESVPKLTVKNERGAIVASRLLVQPRTR